MTTPRSPSLIEPTTVRAAEVDDFATAVAGLHIDYVRTGSGPKPCVVTAAGTTDATLSAGSIGFPVIASTEIPDDRSAFALIMAAPPGAKWNGVDLRPGDLVAYAPSTTYLGVDPIGLAAAVLVVPTESAQHIASSLGAPDPIVPRSVAPLAPSPPVRRLAAMMRRSFREPRVLTNPSTVTTLVESAVGAMTTGRRGGEQRSRKLDSRAIVRNCLDYVESKGEYQPSMSELCRAGYASESRVRQAFIDVVGVPPNRYFQLRLLSRLRSTLTAAGPEQASVTDIAMSLGVTQLGRVAGRYRALYGELPRETLRRAF